jgi:DNA-3-methyladenine glycosylase
VTWQAIEGCDLVEDIRDTHPREFFARPTPAVARDLLGSMLCRRLKDDSIIFATILEVEAYTRDDPACHAFRGWTERVKVLFGPPGYAYIYFIYGAHYCLNVVTEPEGVAAAVLIRAVDAPRANGPGKLCKVFEIDKRHYGLDLCDSRSEVWIARGLKLSDREVLTSPRVGVSSAADRIWRFYIKDHKGVSAFRPYTKRQARLTDAGGMTTATMHSKRH